MRAPNASRKSTNSDQHLFAVYLPALDQLEKVSGAYVITDLSVIHRMHNVLRLQAGDSCIVFDDRHYAYASLKEVTRKRLGLELSAKLPHITLRPSILWLLPLLKREAFEEALYTITEMGATAIQPLYTTKASRAWGSEKDYTRARAVMISAAEQSKQYAIPNIYPIQDIKNWISDDVSTRIFFDAEGAPLQHVLTQSEHPFSFIGCVGPEADLTTEEKQLLKDQGFVFCALTPSVLRAKQAIALGLGILRSYYRS